MKRTIVLSSVLSVLLVLPCLGDDTGRFVREVKLGGTFTAVIAEGDHEPRSIGTFTVRIYRDLAVGDYVTGVLRARDGFVKTVEVQEVKGRHRITVRIETAGSGRYFTDHVFWFDPSKRTLQEVVAGSHIPAPLEGEG